MNTQLRLTFRRGDLTAVGAVVLLAAAVLLFFLPGGEAGGAARIYMDGQFAGELPLSRDGEMQILGDYTNTVAVQNGRAAIISSTCPGEDCVHSGWIESPGRSIVCLPNRVEVRIEGAAEVDFVVG